MKFSVVMPTYNYGRYLSQTIESVLAQTEKDFELIIIDNFSTDNTESVIGQFSDERIRYEKFANHGIVAASRNRGVKLAQGGFVAFLDSDDRWYPQKLERVRIILDENPEIDFVCHDQTWIYENRNGQKLQVRCGPWKSYEDILFRGNSFSTSATVVRREKLLEVNGSSEEKKFAGAEDYELWLRLARVCRIEFLHEPLCEYVIHDGAISGDAILRTEVLINILNAHYAEFLNSDRSFEGLYQKRKAEIYRQGARDLFRQGHRQQAKLFLDESLRFNPWSAKGYYWLLRSLLQI